MLKPPLISIVIPTKNAQPWISQLLRTIENQTIIDKTEIIIIDSGSTDNTLEIAKNHDVRLIRIDANSFNHGLTRNLGVNNARGKFVVMTVQDALPANVFWLEELLKGFSDDTIVGVCGQQIVPHDKLMNPVRWFRPYSPPTITAYSFENPADFERLEPIKKRAICGWDNVTAMYLKSFLQNTPFRNVPFAEDMHWAYDALRTGKRIVYNNSARVFHYHYEDYEFAFKRHFIELYYSYNLFAYIPEYKSTFMHMLSVFKILLKEKSLNLYEKGTWIKYNYVLKKAEQKSRAQFLTDLSDINQRMEDKLQLLFPHKLIAPKP